MATHREAEAVLATWREIERQLAMAQPESPRFERLATDAAFLRDVYQRLVAEVQASKADESSALPGTPEPV